MAGPPITKEEKRVKREIKEASEIDLGIYVEPIQLDSTARLPIRGYAVLVDWQHHAVPNLVEFEFLADYPYNPLTIKLISRVPHPLIADDGSIDLDILNRSSPAWSPAWTLRSVLVAVQSVLAAPTDSDILLPGCVLNADWELGEISTPREHALVLFDLLLKAARASVDGASPYWPSWVFLRGLRSLLCIHPDVYTSSPRTWYGCLRAFANVSSTHRGYSAPAHPTAHDAAKQQCINEMQALLDKHFCFDSLRTFLCMRSLGSDSAKMRRIHQVWSTIRAFLSDIQDEELFAGNRFMLRILAERA